MKEILSTTWNFTNVFCCFKVTVHSANHWSLKRWFVPYSVTYRAERMWFDFRIAAAWHHLLFSIIRLTIIILFCAHRGLLLCPSMYWASFTFCLWCLPHLKLKEEMEGRDALENTTKRGKGLGAGWGGQGKRQCGEGKDKGEAKWKKEIGKRIEKVRGSWQKIKEDKGKGGMVWWCLLLPLTVWRCERSAANPKVIHHDYVLVGR